MKAVLMPLALLLFTGSASAETITVKYRGEVLLDTFDCQVVADSSLVKRVCYDASEAYMIILLKGTYYHYCEVGQEVVQGLLSAPSKGKFFNSSIKGYGSDGPYDCRTHRVPSY